MNDSLIGLALSGGGARGLAHIGVLKVFEREGIPVSFLAGTSFGGLIAASYAAGMDPAEIEAVARRVTSKKEMLKLIDPIIRQGGLLRGERIMNILISQFGEITFENLEIPLAVNAVDLVSQKEIILREGSVAEAVRASISVPGLFTPVKLNGWKLVDGGVLNNLPTDIAYQMGAKKVIAVDIGKTRNTGIFTYIGHKPFIPPGIGMTLEDMDEALYCLRTYAQDCKTALNPPDILIRPEIPAEINILSGYDRIDELVGAGEKAAEEQLPLILSMVEKA